MVNMMLMYSKCITYLYCSLILLVKEEVTEEEKEWVREYMLGEWKEQRWWKWREEVC